MLGDRDRHHRDRRHDVAHSRLRPIGARAVRDDRAEHDFHPAIRHQRFRERRRNPRPVETAEPDRLGRARARATGHDAAIRGHELGAGNGPRVQQRVFYRDQKTRPVIVLGTSEFFAEGTRIPFKVGRFFNGTEVQYRKNVVVLAYGRTSDCSKKRASIRSARWCASDRSDSKSSAPSASGRRRAASMSTPTTSSSIPHTTYQRVYGVRVARIGNLGIDLEHSDLRRAPRGRDGAGRDGRDPAHHAHRVTASSSISRTTSTCSRRTRF